MSESYENDGKAHEQYITEVLAQYPDKFAKRRKKHLAVAKAAEAAPDAPVGEEGPLLTECEVKSNQGRGVGAGEGHGPHQPWPRRLRSVLLVATP
jgi:hypothetical protein